MGTKAPLWNLQELAAQAGKALERDYAGQASGRVREIPDARTIRYYTTLGLLDRPTEWRGRTALYGRRHLLQLVAIKRLQAEGLPLGQVQEQLLGLPSHALARLARVPAEVLEAAPPPDESPAAPSRRAGAFWMTSPPPQADGTPRPEGASQPAPLPQADPATAAPPARPLQALELQPGATLILSSARPLAAADVQALDEAARPLLETLENLGLITRTDRR